MKFGKNECPSNADYQFQGVEDPVTGRRYVDCRESRVFRNRSFDKIKKKRRRKI